MLPRVSDGAKQFLEGLLEKRVERRLSGRQGFGSASTCCGSASGVLKMSADPNLDANLDENHDPGLDYLQC